MDIPTLTHRSLQANGLKFHIALAGPEHGPLALLLHGFPECWYAWRHQAAELAAAGWRVAMPDQRGYGTSDKPRHIQDYHVERLSEDAVAMASALGYKSFDLVGHDWGGIVAWQVAARFPQHVRRMAILNAPRIGTLGSFVLRHPGQLIKSAYVGLFQLPFIPELMLQANGFFALKHAMRASSRPGTFGAAELAVYEKSWSSPGALRAMLNWYRAMDATVPSTESISVPTIVLWGDQDSALEPGLAERAFAPCQEGEVLHVEGATHWLHHEEPALVNAELIRFLSATR